MRIRGRSARKRDHAGKIMHAISIKARVGLLLSSVIALALLAGATLVCLAG
jgi:hypothetical protein